LKHLLDQLGVFGRIVWFDYDDHFVTLPLSTPREKSSA
jgi:hypothetical protein